MKFALPLKGVNEDVVIYCINHWRIMFNKNNQRNDYQNKENNSTEKHENELLYQAYLACLLKNNIKALRLYNQILEINPGNIKAIQKKREVIEDIRANRNNRFLQGEETNIEENEPLVKEKNVEETKIDTNIEEKEPIVEEENTENAREEIVEYDEKTRFNIEHKTYYNKLKEKISDLNILKDDMGCLPEFYRILSNIVSNSHSDWYSKILCTYALSYLVIETDIISDEKPDGYIDDLFICAYVLKKIRDSISQRIILLNLDNVDIKKYDVLDKIGTTYYNSRSYLDEEAENILKLSGIKEFESLDFSNNKYDSREIRFRKERIRLLYSMIAVKSKNLTKYVDTHPDFSEIARYTKHM